MGSVADDKHKTALELLRRWRLRKDVKGREKLLREFVELCAVEVSNGLRVGGGVLAWSTKEHTTEVIRYITLKGVQRALDTATDTRPPHLPSYVQDCVAEVVQETRTDQEKYLRELKPQQIYDMVSPLSRLGAASVLDRISFHQRNALVELILRRWGHKRILMRIDSEPDEHLPWLIWYAFRLHMEEPSAKKLLAEDQDTPTGLMIDLGEELPPQPKNSRGTPINLAGPILVKAFDVLTGLPNNQIPAPARTNTRLGRTFDVDPDVIARWKRHPEWAELRVDVEPDGKGGVRYTFDLDALFRSARIVTGRKRGPQDNSSSEKAS
jgi:hypothetical protein